METGSEETRKNKEERGKNRKRDLEIECTTGMCTLWTSELP
jgi:hypothetical protein